MLAWPSGGIDKRDGLGQYVVQHAVGKPTGKGVLLAHVVTT
jgi:hypothetical protein